MYRYCNKCSKHLKTDIFYKNSTTNSLQQLTGKLVGILTTQNSILSNSQLLWPCTKMIHNIIFKVYNNDNKCNYTRQTRYKNFMILLHNVVFQTVESSKVCYQNNHINNLLAMKDAIITINKKCYTENGHWRIRGGDPTMSPFQSCSGQYGHIHFTSL